jgi:hypothetical protein
VVLLLYGFTLQSVQYWVVLSDGETDLPASRVPHSFAQRMSGLSPLLAKLYHLKVFVVEL